MKKLKYIIIAILGIILAVIFGYQKKGFYIDEYYTYTLANGTQLGIGIEEGRWCDTSQFLSQLVCEQEEAGDYRQCYVNNQNDVHPPLYYFLIHGLSAAFPGCFSKWIGIVVNIMLWIPCMLLVYEIIRRLTDNELIQVLCFAAYVFSPATLSGIMLIRMYVQLSLFVLLYAYIILVDIKRETIAVKGFIIPVFLTGFFGFLTQYYFVIAMFFMTFFYAIYLLIGGWLKRAVVFGVDALVSLMATYFVWPTSVFHIFKGYRGADSVNSLVSATNIGARASLFIGNLNNNVFGGLLPIIVIIFIAAFLLKLAKDKKDNITINYVNYVKNQVNNNPGLVIIGVSSLCYFLVIAKIALKAAEASNRYEYPVYALILIISVIGLAWAERIFLSEKCRYAATAAILLLMLLAGYIRGQVLYLYPSESIMETAFAKQPNARLIMFQKNDGQYDTRIKDYLNFDEVFFASDKDYSQLEDDKLVTLESLFVYIDTRCNEEACLEALEKVRGENDCIDCIFTTPGGGFNVYFIKRL